MDRDEARVPEEKLKEAVRQLRDLRLHSGYSCACRVISGSMEPVINLGESVTVVRADGASIRKGDIIIWESASFPTPNPIVHRVSAVLNEGGRTLYVTRGDRCLQPDDHLVEPAEVIGRVCSVSKRLAEIDLDSPAGRTVHRFIGRVAGLNHLPGGKFMLYFGADVCGAVLLLLLQLTAVARAVLLRSFRAASGALQRAVRRGAGIAARTAAAVRGTIALLSPEPGYVFDRDGLALRYGCCVDDVDWSASRALAAEFLSGITPGRRVADLQFGAGYSDEAFSLLRRGCSVEPWEIFSGAGTAERCDYVIAARCLELLPRRERIALLAAARRRLKDGGRIIACVISAGLPPEDERQSFKRKLWTLLRRRDHPAPGDFVHAGLFIRNRADAGRLRREASLAGCRVLEARQYEKAICLVLAG